MKKKQRRLFRRVYDDLFHREKDPRTANLFLLAAELAEVRGVKLSSKEDLNNFMIENQDALTVLFNTKLPNEEAYLFGKFHLSKGDC